MRIQHVAQTVRGWPDATAEDRRNGARLADIVDQHIRWRLWHGQVQRALDLIGDTLERLDAIASGSSCAAAPAAKLAGMLRSLETYVSGESDLIIDYAAARHSHEPISTATTESTVQWLLHRRMGANQQMRWSPRGCAFDAQGPDFGGERDFQQRSRPCRAVGPPAIPASGLITPRSGRSH
jgi:hypothetical protein